MSSGMVFHYYGQGQRGGVRHMHGSTHEHVGAGMVGNVLMRASYEHLDPKEERPHH